MAGPGREQGTSRPRRADRGAARGEAAKLFKAVVPHLARQGAAVSSSRTGSTRWWTLADRVGCSATGGSSRTPADRRVRRGGARELMTASEVETPITSGRREGPGRRARGPRPHGARPARRLADVRAPARSSVSAASSVRVGSISAPWSSAPPTAPVARCRCAAKPPVGRPRWRRFGGGVGLRAGRPDRPRRRHVDERSRENVTLPI